VVNRDDSTVDGGIDNALHPTEMHLPFSRQSVRYPTCKADTTLSSAVFTALDTLNSTVDGGTNGAVQVPSTATTLVFGTLSVPSKTCKPVACWSNSTSKPRS